MPKQGEKARKLRALSAGKGVKAPKAWFKKIYKKVSKNYPKLGKMRRAAIVGGIWSQASIATKRKIVRKYQK